MRFAALSVFALPNFAAATVIDVSARDECSGGQINCCNSTLESNVTNLSQLGGLLGLSLPNVGGVIGLSCTPIGTLQCEFQPLCCTINSFGGLIALGCTPINL